jgi:hypothetical protein
MKFLTAILITFLLTPGLAAAGDEDYLNDLLANGGNVTIPAGVYVLNHPLILQSNTIISGEVGSNGELGVEFTIKDHAGWKSFVPLFQVNGVQNVTIENIIIDRISRKTKRNSIKG